MTPLVRRWLEIAALVLRILLWPLRWAVAVLFPPSEYDGLSNAVTAKAAQNFVSKHVLQQSHLDAWLTVGFAAAKQQAARDKALLLVYLHSPLNPKSHEFCQRVFGHASVVQFLNNPHVCAFGVSIHTAQGARLAQQLQASAYPLVALLQVPASSSSSSQSSAMNLLVCAQGHNLLEWPAESMVAHLTSCLTRHEVQLAEQLARTLEREQETELRRHQDEEYQQALRADQERERELENKRQEEEDVRNKLQQAKDSIPEEPASGGTMVRFVLPSGMKLNRRFENETQIGTLKAFLTVHLNEKGTEMGRIGLSTSFPRKAYDSNDEETLEEAGLCPQAVLMVQDLDA